MITGCTNMYDDRGLDIIIATDKETLNPKFRQMKPA